MIKNDDLIYTGENFNLILNNIENAQKAFFVMESILKEMEMNSEAQTLFLNEAECKLCVSKGDIGNENDIVEKTCRAIAMELQNSTFYGHAFYDDERGGYQSCADYEYENGVLKIIVIVSLEGPGLCPECGETIVCFDEYNPTSEYVCKECGAKIQNHEDMFDGALPKTKVIEIKIV